tara:strand:+ start:1917 stop:2726 length:810 start_codon:yes stop_codon:yes gene_type:complete
MPDFLTVPDELLYLANAAFGHFDELGYACTVEPKELEYPERPAFVAELNGEHTISVVCSHIDAKHVGRWVRCGKSMTSPTKIAFVLPANGLDQHVPIATAQGAGIFTISDDSTVTMISGGVDLTFQIALPELTDESAAMKRKLAVAYQKFAAGDWRDAFSEACIVLEQEARNYFIGHIETGRIVTINNKGKVKTPTVEAVARMTIGRLYTAFSETQNLNSTDQLVIDTLKKINSARINGAHHRGKNEAAIRPLIGSNMHAIVNCLRALV